MDNTSLVIIIVGIALFFDFINGFHDSSNIIATIISSRALTPGKALILASISEFAGPLIFGTAVATTIGRGIVDLSGITSSIILATLISAIIWNLVTWWLALPSSSSHALIGSLIGASIIANGIESVLLSSVLKVFLILLVSPILGFIVGFMFYRLSRKLTENATPGINKFFKSGQILSSIFLGFSHGTNDAQKTMGIIAMVLFYFNRIDTFYIPLWVIVASASALALGIASGGWRIMKTVGFKIFKIKPIHGFSIQVCASSVILGAALIGGPVSTTHVVSSSVMGVGSGDNPSRVRWAIAKDIMLAWLMTLPVCAVLSGLIYLISTRVF